MHQSRSIDAENHQRLKHVFYLLNNKPNYSWSIN